MKTSVIYKIQSISNPKKIYIGSTIDLNQRWYLHLKRLRNNIHHSKKLQNHYNKYGESDLVLIILEPCFREFLINREQYYMDKLNPFFNCSLIAGSQLGVKRSIETCVKLSNSKKGKDPPNKGIKGIKHWNLSEETKDKMRNAKLGKKRTDVVWNKDKKLKSMSESSKLKMSISHKLNPTKTQFKKGMIAWNKNIERTEETKKKISDSVKKNWEFKKLNKLTA